MSPKKRGEAAIRLRSRRLKQELDAADDRSLLAVKDEEAGQELVDYVPKKKRAALQLKEKAVNCEQPVKCDDDERLQGALALIELANGCTPAVDAKMLLSTIGQCSTVDNVIYN